MKPRLIRDGEGTGIKTCRQCGQQILWALTDRGRRMPVDVQPGQMGEFVVWWSDEDAAHRVTSAANYTGRATERWRSHFATCPKASTKSKNSAKSKKRLGPQLTLFDGGKGGGR